MARNELHAPDGGEAGFTLVELLIAVTLLALVMLIASGGLRLGARAWEMGERRLDAGADLAHVHAFLARVLEQAYPALADAQSNLIDFDGREDALTLLSPMPRALGGGGFARMQLAMSRTPGASMLVVRWRRELGSHAQANPAFEQSVLTAGVRGLTFAYYGSDQAGEPPYWHPSWRQRKSLPMLIRVRIAFEAQEDRTWPELIVKPALHVDATCVYDPVDRACRGRT